ncbi:MAG: FkbM family methyltransferase [Actinobacteria bacterium]|nr:FkbM family methyltransferase [Actinomycetota bacterium]
METIEIEGHPIIPELLNESSIIFDCGACVGEFTSKLYDKYKCRFYLYEADSRNYRRMKHRFQNNQNIYTFNKAIDKDICIKEFYLGDFITASSLYRSHRGLGHLMENVQTTTIDNELFNFDGIDLLKLDLEGSEIDVIPNILPKTLQKIKQITVEFHPQSKIEGYTQEKIDICRNYLKKSFDEIMYVDRGNDGHQGLYLNKL